MSIVHVIFLLIACTFVLPTVARLTLNDSLVGGQYVCVNFFRIPNYKEFSPAWGKVVSALSNDTAGNYVYLSLNYLPPLDEDEFRSLLLYMLQLNSSLGFFYPDIDEVGWSVLDVWHWPEEGMVNRPIGVIDQGTLGVILDTYLYLGNTTSFNISVVADPCNWQLVDTVTWQILFTGTLAVLFAGCTGYSAYQFYERIRSQKKFSFKITSMGLLLELIGNILRLIAVIMTPLGINFIPSWVLYSFPYLGQQSIELPNYLHISFNIASDLLLVFTWSKVVAKLKADLCYCCVKLKIPSMVLAFLILVVPIILDFFVVYQAYLLSASQIVGGVNVAAEMIVGLTYTITAFIIIYAIKDTAPSLIFKQMLIKMLINSITSIIHAILIALQFVALFQYYPQAIVWYLSWLFIGFSSIAMTSIWGTKLKEGATMVRVTPNKSDDANIRMTKHGKNSNTPPSDTATS